jgi:phage FluMu protein Com
MSQKIDVRCNHCGQLLFKKTIPERKGEKEYGGIEIKCTNCETLNIIGVKREIPWGERLRLEKKAG